MTVDPICNRRYRWIILSAALTLPACAEAAPQAPETHSAVATSGLAPAAAAALVDEARALPRLHALIVARDGRTIVSERLRGPALDRPVNIKSASKTLLATLAGIAIARGVLDGPDQPIAPILARDVPAGVDPRIGRITVGNLMSMQAGLGSTSGANYGRWVSSPNWVRAALARPFEDAAGGRMIYSTGSSHLLSAVLTRASGRSTHQLMREWLGGPLGIAIPPWSADPQGIFFGGNDMLVSPQGLLAFGEMIRRGGRAADGTQVVPAAWIAESWRPRAVSPWSGNSYGYGWFTRDASGHAVHFAWGYGGQMVYVVPSLALTVVMTSDPSPRARDDHVARLHGLLDRYIVPGAIRGG